MVRVNSGGLRHLVFLVTAATLATLVAACGGGNLETEDFNNPRVFRIGEDAEIEDTPENREILGVVEEYRDAMTERDGNRLRNLISREYAENGSTTHDGSDDYGNEKLEELLSYYLGERVQEVRYDLEVKDISRNDYQVHVDYLYYWSFRYVADGRDHWKSDRDVNRITLVQEDGQWKITSGL